MSDIFKNISFPDEPAEFADADEEIAALEAANADLQARLAEYEGENKRWHSFETVRALAKERDALQAEANRYYANWQAEKSIIHNVESGTQWATSNVKPDDRSATLEAARDKLSAECDAPHCQSAILRAERDLWRKRANALLEIAKAATDIVDATYVIRNSGSYIVSGVEFERLQRAVETVKQMSEEEGK